MPFITEFFAKLFICKHFRVGLLTFTESRNAGLLARSTTQQPLNEPSNQPESPEKPNSTRKMSSVGYAEGTAINMTEAYLYQIL